MTASSESYAALFAAALGVKHAFPFWKGRVALYAILRALGVERDDEIIVPGYTCVMNINPIVYLGARPVYVDIDPDTFNLNPAVVEAALTPRTRVIIAQHTYGYLAPMDKLLDLAERRNVAVIEDCCLALGSRCKGRLAGTMGRAAYFSSQWSKPYTTGLGGVAVTSDGALARSIAEFSVKEAVEPRSRELFMLRAQFCVHRALVYPVTTAVITRVFRLLSAWGLVVGSSAPSEFSPVPAADFFKRMSSSQQRWGAAAVRRMQANIDHRKRLTGLYDELLSKAGWPPRRVATGSEPVLVRYPLRVANKDEVLHRAGRSGVEIGSWFEAPLHPRETPHDAYDYQFGMCPAAEQACRETINLPLHPRVSERTAERCVRWLMSIGSRPAGRDG